MSRRPASPAKWVTCGCGKVCRGRAGFAHHARVCPVESARSSAFVAAVENGQDPHEAARAAEARALRDLEETR